VTIMNVDRGAIIIDETGESREEANPASAIMPRATVEQIVERRNEALRRYDEAYDTLTVAQEAISAAVRMSSQAKRSTTSYNYHQEQEQRNFLCNLKIAEADQFKAAARRLTDTDCWSHIIELTDLQRLMDKKAKDELRTQLQTDPPEITVENIYATLQQFMLDADTIFRRGIALCFSTLDRRFRSHDGWKIGSRIILSYAFNEWGSWNYHRSHDDSLRDIERTFLVLDGKDVPPDYAGIVTQVYNGRQGGSGARQSEYENDYFIIRGFKNGNAHVWFKRDDLVEKVNKLLAEYYGEVIPEERAPEDDGGLYTPKTSLAKNYGFFPTPDPAAQTVAADAYLRNSKGAPFRVLEPNAGTGNLARLAVKAGAVVDCIEIQGHLAQTLRDERIYRRVIEADFLAMQPDPNNLYDSIIMNPPFDRERDIDHVMHAMKFLKPDGWLTAIMSAGTEFRETRKSKAFREFMEKKNARYRDLPAGSFTSVGTNVNTLYLRVCNDGRRQSW